MIRRPPRSTRTDTLFPYTTLFRSYPLARKLPLRAAAGDGGVWTAVHPSQNSKLQEKARPEPRFPLAALRVDYSTLVPNEAWLSAGLASGVGELAEPWTTITRPAGVGRSEEHTSELQSLMRISYAVYCLKK